MERRHRGLNQLRRVCMNVLVLLLLLLLLLLQKGSLVVLLPTVACSTRGFCGCVLGVFF